MWRERMTTSGWRNDNTAQRGRQEKKKKDYLFTCNAMRNSTVICGTREKTGRRQDKTRWSRTMSNEQEDTKEPLKSASSASIFWACEGPWPLANTHEKEEKESKEDIKKQREKRRTLWNSFNLSFSFSLLDIFRTANDTKRKEKESWKSRDKEETKTFFLTSNILAESSSVRQGPIVGDRQLLPFSSKVTRKRERKNKRWGRKTTKNKKRKESYKKTTQRKERTRERVR